MFSRIALLAAAGLLATACATSAGSSGTSAPSDPGAATVPAPATPASSVTVENLAGVSFWLAEENLIPDDPILALVRTGARNADVTAGVAATCNAANGNITLRLGKQPTTRAGQSATFKVRSGAGARDVNGKFEQKRGATDADFVFPISSADLLALGQPDMVSFVTDQGEVQWALVKQADAQVQAKYVGSLKDFQKAAADFLNYCNPK